MPLFLFLSGARVGEVVLLVLWRVPSFGAVVALVTCAAAVIAADYDYNDACRSSGVLLFLRS